MGSGKTNIRSARVGIQDTDRRRSVQEMKMSNDIREKIQELLEETTIALGATDQTYIGLLRTLQTEKMLMIPNRVISGQLVFFKYKPVLESSTYYDRYPLVLVTDSYKGGFEGVNLHFVDPQHRKFLFDSLMRTLPTIKSSEEWKTRLKVDYDKLKARRAFKYFRPCYRRYLWKGMSRRPVIVPFQAWEDMINGNTYRFVNARPVTVFRESRKQVIRRGR